VKALPCTWDRTQKLLKYWLVPGSCRYSSLVDALVEKLKATGAKIQTGVEVSAS
jgi:hypothetical protein